MKIDSLPIPIRIFAYTIFMLGSIHLIISNVAAFVFGDWEQINYFHILAIDLIWPQLGKGATNTLISQIFWIVPIFWLWYFIRQSRAAKRQSQETTKTS